MRSIKKGPAFRPFILAERVGFEPTDGTLEIKKLLENCRLLVPSKPLASPFVPVDSASSSVVSQLKFCHEEGDRLCSGTVTHNLSQTFGRFLRLLPAVEHAKHGARLAIDPIIHSLWKAFREQAVEVEHLNVNSGVEFQ